MSEDQPSEAQEIANAAYVWRKEVQEKLLAAMRDPNIKLENAEWQFERFRRAYLREIETADFALSHSKAK